VRKFIKIGIIVVVVIAVLFGVFRAIKKKSAVGEVVTAVRMEKPIRGELVEYVTCPGQLEPKKKVTISAKVSARIIALPYKMGQRVTCGDPNANPPIPPSVLVSLDSTELETELRATLASKAALASQLEMEKESVKAQEDGIAAVEATLKQAELDLARKKELLRTKDISKSTFEQAQSKYDELRANKDSAVHRLESSRRNLHVIAHNLEGDEARIQRAQQALTYTTITSPIDGVITQVNAEVGEVVIFGTMNNPGTVIIEVADLSQMLVAAEVDEVDIAKIQKGQKAKVRIAAFDGNDFTGTVDTVALKNGMSQSTSSKYFKVEILLDDTNGRICSGLTADVDIEVKKHSDILKVPSQAIVGREVDSLEQEIKNNPLVDKRKTFAAMVYKFVDGKAVATPVKTGASDLQYTIIEEGLKDTDKIVTGPYKVLESIKHNQAIKEEKKDDKGGKDANSVKPSGKAKDTNDANRI
jgi:HlyD family secretion protein